MVVWWSFSGVCWSEYSFSTHTMLHWTTINSFKLPRVTNTLNSGMKWTLAWRLYSFKVSRLAAHKGIALSDSQGFQTSFSSSEAEAFLG